MREKELRFAMICSGGISLAVYMHGITKEIWRLAAASRAWHDGSAIDGSGAIYRKLLAAIEAKSGVRLRVLADIVAGASAGGINAIFLARARSEEHTSELQSLMRISYAVFCLKKKNNNRHTIQHTDIK